MLYFGSDAEAVDGTVTSVRSGAFASRRDERTARQRPAKPDGETRTRTGDTTIFSRVLYQLSYLALEPRG
jgi:hypothetical protein